jgi:hypothetical protein
MVIHARVTRRSGALVALSAIVLAGCEAVLGLGDLSGRRAGSVTTDAGGDEAPPDAYGYEASEASLFEEGDSPAADEAQDASPSPTGDMDAFESGPPPLVVVRGETPTPVRGGGGGSPGTDVCPGDQMVVGYLGSSDTLVHGLQVVCGRVTVVGAGPYRVVVSSGATLASHGSVGGPTFSTMCSANQVVVGIDGHSGSVVDQFGIECAPLTVVQSGPGFALAIGATTKLPTHGGTGGSPYDDPCPTGQVARGSMISSGFLIDSAALLCGLPTVLSCVSDLSNIGAGDFHVSFAMTTTQIGLVALLNQRAVCTIGDFWDIRMQDGSLLVEISGAGNYAKLTTSGPIVNDGLAHSVVVERVAGAVAAFIDGASVAVGPSTASFGPLPALMTGKDVCHDDGTVGLIGTVANGCLTSP